MFNISTAKSSVRCIKLTCTPCSNSNKLGIHYTCLHIYTQTQINKCMNTSIAFHSFILISFHSASNSNYYSSKCLTKKIKRYQNLFLSSGKKNTQDKENFTENNLYALQLIHTHSHILILEIQINWQFSESQKHKQKPPQKENKNKGTFIHIYIKLYLICEYYYIEFGFGDLNGWITRCTFLYVCEWVCCLA